MKSFEKILKIISNYFQEHKVCDGLIHFGSSVDSENYHDVDLLCYFEHKDPSSHRKILFAIYILKEKYPNVTFNYNEYKIGDYKKKNLEISITSFGSGIKNYYVFKYGVMQSYSPLFGIDPIKNSRKPTLQECMENLTLIFNIKKEFPYMQLKSFLRSALLAKGTYTTKDNLIEEFEKTYDTTINKVLVDLFSFGEEKKNQEISNALKDLYYFILKTNNGKHTETVDLGEITPIIKFRIDVYNTLNSMLSNNEKKEKVLSYLDKKQEEYSKLFNNA